MKNPGCTKCEYCVFDSPEWICAYNHRLQKNRSGGWFLTGGRLCSVLNVDKDCPNFEPRRQHV